jgi:hypothetical protein
MFYQKAALFVWSEDRPDRDTVIEKDEIISLVIDLETMTPEQIYSKYFTIVNE